MGVIRPNLCPQHTLGIRGRSPVEGSDLIARRHTPESNDGQRMTARTLNLEPKSCPDNGDPVESEGRMHTCGDYHPSLTVDGGCLVATSLKSGRFAHL